MPDGFPKVRNEADRALTTAKVIVIRDYSDLFSRNLTGQDQNGHGTAVAAAAAASVHDAPNLGVISGMAPAAHLGAYKTSDAQGNSRTDALLLAVNDAVVDGMDIINLSLGPLVTSTGSTIMSRALERAESSGVLVVNAAGNEGPNPNTLGLISDLPSLVAAGSSSSDRGFRTGIFLSNGQTYVATLGNGPVPAEAVRGMVADVTSADTTGLACGSLPAGAFPNRILLILRGECNFSVKINNAERAGALGVIIYTQADNPVSALNVEGARLPAMMISHADGLQLRRLVSEGAVEAAMTFTAVRVSLDVNNLSGFSSRGPDTNPALIKPDLVAVGQDISLPVQTNNQFGRLYSQGGYATLQGTSFSAPIVAGGLAVIKAARPGLSPAQYRSLLTNSAEPMRAAGKLLSPQDSGAGRLNVVKALNQTVTVTPMQAGFGVGTNAAAGVILTFSNLASEPDSLTFEIEASQGAQGPALSTPALSLDARGTGGVTLRFPAEGLAPGAYFGHLIARSGRTGGETRVPYWLAIPTNRPARITPLLSATSAFRGGTIEFDVKVTDSSGLLIPGLTLNVAANGTAAAATTASVISALEDASLPGLYVVRVRLATTPGTNSFRIQAGDATATVLLTGN
jgi:subtilisin family serine protease